MKTRYTLPLFLLVTFPILAQPTLNMADMVPSLGDSYEYTLSDYVAAGPPGAGQTWNFAASSGTADQVFTYVLPTASADNASYPTATHCWEYQGSIYNFSIFNSNGIYDLGTAISGFGTSVLSNSLQVLKFPATFNTAWTDTYSGTNNLFGTGSLSGTVASTCDGYGTLITPSGTFSNVLRIKTEKTQTNIMNGATSTEVGTQYFWVKAGYSNPLAEIYQVVTTSMGSSTTDEGMRYLSEAPVGVEEFADANADFTVFPNPVTEQLSVIKLGQEQLAMELRILDALGRVALVQQVAAGVGNVTFDVAALSPGHYVVESILDNGQRTTRKFLKQ